MGLGWVNVSSSNLTAKEVVAPYAKVYDSVKAEVQRLSLHSEVLDQLLAADVDSDFSSLESAGTKDPEALSMPYLRAVAKVRDELRKIAPASPSKKEILTLSDQIRDSDLFNLGVYLDDRTDGQSSLIKFIPKEELLAQREEKAALEKAEKAKVSPADMFRDERFSAWDAEGMPTKTKDGEDVPKSALKKMKKEWDRQKKMHEEWKAKNA